MTAPTTTPRMTFTEAVERLYVVENIDVAAAQGAKSMKDVSAFVQKNMQKNMQQKSDRPVTTAGLAVASYVLEDPEMLFHAVSVGAAFIRGFSVVQSTSDEARALFNEMVQKTADALTAALEGAVSYEDILASEASEYRPFMEGDVKATFLQLHDAMGKTGHDTNQIREYLTARCRLRACGIA